MSLCCVAITNLIECDVAISNESNVKILTPVVVAVNADTAILTSAAADIKYDIRAEADISQCYY